VIPADEVFAELRVIHDRHVRAARRGKKPTR